MLEADRIRLADMAQRIDLILGWIAGIDEAAFMADIRTRDAIALNIQLLGETARRMSEDVKARAPAIPWPAIVALRNRIAHGYEMVDHMLVWRIVQGDLPSLQAELRRLLGEAP